MSRAIRIDKVKVAANGNVFVEYTYGNAPLPVEAAGYGICFNSRLEAVAQKNRLIANFDSDEMLLFAIAIYSIAAADPNLTGASAMVGKTLTLDPTKPASVMSYA